MTGRINRLLEARWAAAGIRPTAEAGDAEFVRRVWLDLAGKIPPVSDARAFLEERKPGKRQRLVERLLQSPSYATHFSHFWRAVLMPENANVNLPGLDLTFEAWLRSRLRDNTSYDRMVREILTATPRTGRAVEEGLVLPTGRQVSPVAFYLANENKPENLAGSTRTPVPGGEAGVRPVPQSSPCGVEAGAVLGIRGLLRRHPQEPTAERS